MFRFTQNDATANRRIVVFYAASTTDGYTAVTSGITSPVITIYKNGTGTAVVPSTPTVTHLTNGLWSYQLAQTDIDTTGMLTITIAHASIRSVHLVGYVYSGDAFNAPTTTQTGYLDAAVSTRLSATGTVANLTGNFAGSVGSVASAVTVGTMNNSTISSSTFVANALDAVWNTTTRTITGGTIGSVASGGITSGSFAANALDAVWGTTTRTITGMSANAIDTNAIQDGAIVIRLASDSTPSEARLVAGAVASDVWNASIATYDGTSQNTTGTFGKAIVKSDASTKNGDVTMYSISGTNGIDVDIHRIANDQTAATNLKNVFNNTGTTTLGAQFASTGNIAIADATLARDLGSGTNAGALNERTVRSALRALRNKTSITGTTLTVTNETDNTSTGVAWTATLTTNPLADPVTGIDPV